MSGGSVSTSVDGFAETLASACLEVVDKDKAILKREIRGAGRSVERELHQTSPRRTGRYAAGWGARTTEDSDEHVTCCVYNRTDWQLTHLLEKGHEQVFMGHDTGHRYPGVRHIEPAYEHGRDRLLGGM